MTLIRLPSGVVGTRLPNTPTTGNPFRYQGPHGDEKGKALVAALRAMFPELTAEADERERERRADLAMREGE